ncbi:MAG: CapA family protein, partial [Ilumatobacteraceae bacterium]
LICTTAKYAVVSTIPPARTVTMAFSGDVLIHTSLWEQARETAGGAGYDFSPMFAETEPIVAAADLGVCHLEVPIAPPGKEPSTFPLYGAPRELVAGIKSGGYDRCSTASNHTLDQGTAGIEATLAEFDAQQMGQSGMARSAAEIEPRVFDVNGVTICHLAYTWGFNGLSLPSDEPWRSAEIDPDRIIRDATAARELGAEVVVVSMHWGAETVAAVTSTQRSQADAITASGQVDLIVGHHTHVVQPIEQVNGVWTVFGMGNVLSNHPTRDFFPPSSQDGVIVTVSIEVAADGTVTVAMPVVHPTWVDRRNGFVIRDVLKDLADPDLDGGLRASLEESLDRTRRMVGDFIAS